MNIKGADQTAHPPRLCAGLSLYLHATMSGISHSEVYLISYGPLCEKTCLQWFANNKGIDQPELPRSLISAFVICSLESIISELATSTVLIF